MVDPSDFSTIDQSEDCSDISHNPKFVSSVIDTKVTSTAIDNCDLFLRSGVFDSEMHMINNEKMKLLTTDERSSFIKKLEESSAIVFDTETSALNGHVIQLAIVLIDSNKKEIGEYNKYLKLDKSIKIDKRAQQVHNISEDVLNQMGVLPEEELLYIHLIFRICRYKHIQIFAHNALFDTRRLNETSQFYRLSDVLSVDDVVCTMKQSSIHCDLKDRNGKRKNPKCSELYFYLFGMEYNGVLHNAIEDTRMTARCVIEGSERGYWNI